jgi:NAD(P)-dependent dehydrogenase (short-subunit alcohol dehydrogenase family)
VRQLEGRVAVVTGAASGIGRAIAQRFGEEHMQVVLADVEAPALEKAVAALSGAGHEVHGVLCDVRRYDSVEALANEAVARYGRVHVVCNNAGVGGGSHGSMWEYELSDWAWATGVNVMGVVHGIKAFVPILLEQEEGHVVNTSSGNGGLAPLPGTPIYAMTKAAVTTLSENLYGQLAAVTDRVKCSVLYPGPNWMRTGLYGSERNRPPELAQTRQRPTPPPTYDDLKHQMLEAGIGFEETPLEQVADVVVRGILEERFWMLPPSARADQMIRTRAESMLGRINPDYMLDQRPPAAGGLAKD